MFFQDNLQNISTTISTDRSTISLENPLMIAFFIHNNHCKKQSVCEYMTPFEGFKGNLFEVIDEYGNKVAYQGIMKKRKKATQENYMNIKSKESVQVRFDLFKNYTLKNSGKYTIQFKGSQHLNQLPDSNILDIIIK